MTQPKVKEFVCSIGHPLKNGLCPCKLKHAFKAKK